MTVNDRLATALDRMHPKWTAEAESTRVLADAAAAAPDIVVRMSGGMPVIVETEYAPAREVELDASQRLGMELAATGDPIEQAVAVRLPPSLASVPQAELSEALDAAPLEYCILSLTEGGDPSRFPGNGWISGDIGALARLIECIAVSERQMALALRAFEAGVSHAAGLVQSEITGERSAALRAVCSALHQENTEQTLRMAMTIVTNALTFHNAIAPMHEGVPSIEQLRNGGALLPADLHAAWRAILKINYWPIFEIANRVLLPLPADVGRRVLERLAGVADELVGLGIATTQDMTGQIFGRLIADRKFLATFYTRPSSASLLAELAVSRLACDFGDQEEVRALRIADLACGTGALLSAAYGHVASRCRQAGINDAILHPACMERVFVGADIMPAAVHVTASMLSAVHPSVPFGDTNIHLMPYGLTTAAGPEANNLTVTSIGSLELIDDVEATSLFGTGRSVAAGTGERPTDDSEHRFVLAHGAADIVIMNPPYVRTVGQEGERVGVPRPAFAGFGNSEAEQTAMSERLTNIALYRGRGKSAGHGHAGLASYFLDLAHVKVRPGGTIAFVLPATFCTTSAWRKARALLRDSYESILVVSLAAHGSTDRAFSDDTAMAEVLVIATRRLLPRLSPSETRSNGEQDEAPARVDSVCWVALLDRPDNHAQAVELARNIEAARQADAAYGDLHIGDDRIGVWFRGEMSDGGYGQVSAFDVALSAAALAQGALRLARVPERQIPIVRLGALGQVGPGNAAIGVRPRSVAALERGTGAYGAPFRIRMAQFQGDSWRGASYPVLWAHSTASGRESRLEVLPDSLGELAPDASDEDARRVWDQAASRLHMNLEFQLNSQRLGACWSPRCIGGRAWPSFHAESSIWNVPLLLWCNTTLGLLARWWVSSRQQNGRANLSIGRVGEIPVLDVRQLDASQMAECEEIFSRFRLREFLPANEAYRDVVRGDLDRAVLFEVLGVPDSYLEPFDTLRYQWCCEPTVHGGQDTRPVV
ncbi:hypothetical protein [Candidatus Poriferisodalis sp.]|uniref:hypothetical protein n=1 Tax=Candidatus Poriferisodalis sp. TaxID=3101277 RepID=UPI003B02D3ED